MSNIYIKEPPTSGKILLHTSMGDIDIELWSKEAPMACRNFVQLCMEGYYNDVIFHRVVPGFIVQGGDPTGTGEGGESVYGEPFKDEFHQRLRFVRRGLVAMANAGLNDNGSQFFFTLGPCNDLNKKHTIFGKVTGDTVYNMIRLGEVGTDENERPINPPFIKWTKVLANPFEDIVPRVEPEKKKRKEEEKKKKSQSKATKDFKLLSFGEEAELDEDESNEFAFKGSKSSHDLAKDPKLSSAPAVLAEEKVEESEREDKSGSDDEESVSDSEKEKRVQQVKEKLKRKREDGEEGKTEIPPKVPANSNKAEELRKYSRKLARELAGKNKQKAKDDDMSSDEEQEEISNNPMFADYKAQQKLYRNKTAENKKKGSSREAETLALLNSFKTKILNVREEAGWDAENDEETGKKSNQEENDEEDDNNVGWMMHVFKNEAIELRDAKDMNKDVNEDRYDLTDPRNPLNQRRREKDKKKKRSESRRHRDDSHRESSRSRHHRR